MIGIWILMSFIFAAVAASMAASRQRSELGWGFAGAAFGLIAIMVLLAIPKPEAPNLTA